MVSAGFAELERQQQLLASCTRLYQQLVDHFGSLERGISARSDALRVRRRAFDAHTHRALEAFHRQETSIDYSISLAIDQLHSISSSAAAAAAAPSKPAATDPSDAESKGLTESLPALCLRMDSAAFLGFVVARRKEADALRAVVPLALKLCVDAAKFVMDAVADIFPVDHREVWSPADLAWACVLILEAAVPALADPDPDVGVARTLVTWAARDRARAMATEWKEAAEKKGALRAPSRPTRTPSCSTSPPSPSPRGRTGRSTAGLSSASPGAARCHASRSRSASRKRCQERDEEDSALLNSISKCMEDHKLSPSEFPSFAAKIALLEERVGKQKQACKGVKQRKRAEDCVEPNAP